MDFDAWWEENSADALHMSEYYKARAVWNAGKGFERARIAAIIDNATPHNVGQLRMIQKIKDKVDNGPL